MSEVSARELRNHTAAILRRAESGERVSVTVNRRPVAELGPLGRPTWFSGAALQRLLAEAPADRGLLRDLEAIRGQAIDTP